MTRVPSVLACTLLAACVPEAFIRDSGDTGAASDTDPTDTGEDALDTTSPCEVLDRRNCVGRSDCAATIGVDIPTFSVCPAARWPVAQQTVATPGVEGLGDLTISGFVITVADVAWRFTQAGETLTAHAVTTVRVTDGSTPGSVTATELDCGYLGVSGAGGDVPVELTWRVVSPAAEPPRVTERPPASRWNLATVLSVFETPSCALNSAIAVRPYLEDALEAAFDVSVVPTLEADVLAQAVDLRDATLLECAEARCDGTEAPITASVDGLCALVAPGACAPDPLDPCAEVVQTRSCTPSGDAP